MDVYETGGNFEDHGAEITALRASRLRLAKSLVDAAACDAGHADVIVDARRIVREEG